jgi:hypothetical protein
LVVEAIERMPRLTHINASAMKIDWDWGKFEAPWKELNQQFE